MEWGFALAFGLTIGSFLNVCIFRLPLEQSVVHPRSRCPRCARTIVWYDNIPILSFLLLGGKCRRCRQPISIRYPVVEAVTGLLALIVFSRYPFFLGSAFEPGAFLQWLTALGFAAAMLVLLVVDIDHRILPDPITLNGIWIAVLLNVTFGYPSPFAARLFRWLGFEVVNVRVLAFTGSLLGLAFGGGLLWLVGEAFYRIRGIEGMGFGDVKMMAMVGAFLGLPLAALTIMMGSFIGSIAGLILMRFFGKSREYELPFGTFLGGSAIVVSLYGEDLMQLYFERFIQTGL